MSNLIADLTKKIFKKNTPVLSIAGIQLIKSRKLLLDVLIDCCKNERYVGIYSDVLGEGMFVTGVHDIYDYDEEPIIMLKRYDITGSLLIRETLSLGEIKAACVFDNSYRHPIIES
jgi:hypothetical protein